MLLFPIHGLLDEQACCDYLVGILHPTGLHCPCGQCLAEDQAPHKRRGVISSFRCGKCHRVFNLFTDTVWSRTRRSCAEIVRIVQGFAQGTPTLHLAKELACDYGTLLELRHELQQLSLDNLPTTSLADEVAEADEMFQNAGEKGCLHQDPLDPPRCRANSAKGIGTMANDRPPIVGVVGRESEQIRLRVCDNTRQITILPHVEQFTRPDVILNTDESYAYLGVTGTGRVHCTVCHSQGEYARDDDGDGFCEVHCNTMEGIWTGLRNFLRPFRGVSKKYLAAYVAMFEWAHNLKRVTNAFLRALILTFANFQVSF